MRWVLIGFTVLAFAFAGAGCGGGDDNEASATDTTLTDTSSTEETTTEDTETDTTDTGAASGNFSSGDCAELAGAGSALGQAFSSGGQADLDQIEKLFDDFADRVPDDLKDDVQVLSDAYSKYLQALKDAGIDPSDLNGTTQPTAAETAKLVKAYAAVAKSIDVQAVQTASTNLSTWAGANCQGG